MINFWQFLAGLIVTFFKAVGREELLAEQLEAIKSVQGEWDKIDSRPDTFDGAVDDLRRRSKDSLPNSGGTDPRRR